MTDNTEPSGRDPDQGRHLPLPHEGDRAGRSPSDVEMNEEPPFGLPVLAEVPELAMVLDQLCQADRLIAMALEGLIRLQDHSISESFTGLPLERWLAAIAGRTGSDRRMLMTAATACRRLPCLRTGFSQGRLSWAQVRSVALKVQDLPRHLDDQIDGAISTVINGRPDTDPDALCRVISWTLHAIEANNAPEPSPSAAPEADWVAMQPRLDATGGQIHGDFGAEGFALLDAALNAGPPAGGRTRTGIGADIDRETARGSARQFARARAERLKQLCRTGAPASRPGQDEHPTANGAPGVDLAAQEATADAPDGDLLTAIPGNQTLLRADLDTVLDRMPAALLTRLTGGSLHVDAQTARRLMDTYGTRLRLVLVDHGRIVGVGRAARQPPGWLAEATLALHDTCTEPGCNIAARICDIDHAQPWADRGRSDIDQLAPVCATANHDKENAGWTVTQQPDGVRVWTHRRTGLTTTTLPTRWQPPDDRADGHDGPDRSGNDPPHGGLPDGEPPGGVAPPGSDPPRGDPDDRNGPDRTTAGSDPPGPHPADADPDDIPF